MNSMMNSIRKIKIKEDNVYLSCTRFGIPNENFKNDVLSAAYKEGGQAALDRAVLSMLLNDCYRVELNGDDPSLQPYQKALEAAKQQHVLDFYKDRINQKYELYLEKKSQTKEFTKLNFLLSEYTEYRNEQIQNMLNAVAALIVR